MSTRRGFTLIEMLLVVAILSLLIAILLPTLGKMRGVGEETQCKTQLRQIGEAFLRFTLDNRGFLPASSVGGWEGNYDWQKCWIGREGRVPTLFEPPADGPLAKYIGLTGNNNYGNRSIYRCPSLRVTARYGGGSNGGFDYTMMLSFSGARIKSIPLRARTVYMSDPFGPVQENLRTPIAVEENPDYHANSISVEPGFGSIDRMADHHVSRSSNYATIDGGVETYYVKASRPPQAWEWFIRAPSGAEHQLNGGVTYNYWRTQ